LRCQWQANQWTPVAPHPQVHREQVRQAEGGSAQAVNQGDVQAPYWSLVEEAAVNSPQVSAEAPVEAQESPSAGPTRQSTRSTRGVAPQRLTYEVRGQPTAYYLAECFHNMIQGLVACVGQKEYQQCEFLAIISSSDRTVENWPRSL